MSHLRLFLIIFSMFFVVACNASERILPTPVALATPTSKINTPTAVAAASKTPKATQSATNTSSSAPQQPVFFGTPYPEPVGTIAAETVHQIQQLAYLDKGRMNQAIYSPDGDLIAVASSIGIFLYDATTLEQVRFIGTDSMVHSVAFSPDSQTLLSGSEHGTVHLWSMDGTLIRSLEGHTSSVNSVTFSSDGLIIAAGDSEVRLWDTTGTPLHRLSGSIVVFSPDDSLVATGSSDGTIRLWSMDGTMLKVLSGHRRRVTSIAFSPDSQTFASGSQDRTMRLWSTDGTSLHTSEYPDEVRSVAFSPDGQMVAGALRDATVRLWDARGKPINTLSGHASAVESVAFSPDGRTVLSGSSDGTVRLWDTTGTLLNSLSGHPYEVGSVAFSPDGKMLASGSWNGEVRLWDATGTLLHTLIGHSALVTSVAFSPDSKMLVSGSHDGDVRLWSTDGPLIKTLEGNTDWVNGVAFSPDGKRIASASWGTVNLWDTTGTLLKTLEQSGNLRSVVFSPDGLTFAATGMIYSYDGTPQTTLEGSYELAFSPDGLILAGAFFSKVRLWDATGTLIKSWEGEGFSIESLAFSPDGLILATASSDHMIRLWSTDGTGMPARLTLLRTLSGHTDWASGVAFSPDGTLLASGSFDGTVRLWGLLESKSGPTTAAVSASHTPQPTITATNTQRPTKRATPRATNTPKSGPTHQPVRLGTPYPQPIVTIAAENAHEIEQLAYLSHEEIGQIVYSPDGNVLAVASLMGIHLLDTQKLEYKLFINPGAPAYSIAFSPDSKTLVAGLADGRVQQWSDGGALLKTFGKHVYGVTSVAISQDGQTIASGSVTEVRLWEISGTSLGNLASGDAEVERRVIFSPDGSLVAANFYNSVSLWSTNALRQGSFEELIQVNDMAFSPDGSTLAFAPSDDEPVHLRSIDGTPLQILSGHRGEVLSVAFSPDGKILASATDDQTIFLWSIDGTLIRAFEAHSGEVLSVAFSPDGKTLASASADGTIRLWGVPP